MTTRDPAPDAVLLLAGDEARLEELRAKDARPTFEVNARVVAFGENDGDDARAAIQRLASVGHSWYGIEGIVSTGANARRIGEDVAARRCHGLERASPVRARKNGGDAWDRPRLRFHIIIHPRKHTCRVHREAGTTMGEDENGTSGAPSSAMEGAASIVFVDVEDDRAIPNHVGERLNAGGDAGFEVTTTTSPVEAIHLVDAGGIECVVSGYELHEMTGLELLRRVRELAPELPFILFAGNGSGEIARRAISGDVTDYLLDDHSSEQVEQLVSRIDEAVTGYRERERQRFHESLLTDIATNLSESVFVTDAGYGLVYISDIIEDIYGIPKTALEEEPGAFVERVDPAHRHRLDGWTEAIDADATADELEPEYEIEYRYDHPERGWRWINATMNPILDGNGEITRVVGVISDVTEKQEALEELRRNEAKFRGIAETSNDVIFRVDTAGTVTYASPALRDVLGYDPDDIEGGEFREFIAEDDVEIARGRFAKWMEGKELPSTTINLRHADGDAVPVEVNSAPIRRDGEIVGVQGVARDITDRRSRERELEQYETIVNTVPDGVFVLDEDGRILSANDRAARMVGLEDRRDDLPTEPVPEMDVGGIGSDDAIEEYTDAVTELVSGDRERTMYRLSAAVDGERRVFELHLALRPGDEGEFRGTVGVLREITDRHRYERELERQNERLQQFASTVSHDLRNPLNVAQGRVGFALQSGDTEPLQSAEEALDRMEDLIDNILSLARQSRPLGETTSVPLEAVARQAWTTVETADAELVVEEGLGTTKAEESRLRRLFENFFRNAVEHGSTSPPSQAREGAVEHGGDDVSVTVGPLSDEPGFFVSDDGPGIPDEERERVFEQGYSSAGSTGFGLAIVRDIAEAHGWTVTLTESADGGTHFEVREEGLAD